MLPTDTTLAVAVPAFSHGQVDPTESKSPCKESGASPGQVLLIDYDLPHAGRLSEYLRMHGLSVEISLRVPDAARRLRRASAQCEIVVLINVSNPSRPWLQNLRTLIEASHASDCVVSGFLCVSAMRREPLFEFQVEQMGARLVYEL